MGNEILDLHFQRLAADAVKTAVGSDPKQVGIGRLYFSQPFPARPELGKNILHDLLCPEIGFQQLCGIPFQGLEILPE